MAAFQPVRKPKCFSKDAVAKHEQLKKEAADRKKRQEREARKVSKREELKARWKQMRRTSLLGAEDIAKKVLISKQTRCKACHNPIIATDSLGSDLCAVCAGAKHGKKRGGQPDQHSKAGIAAKAKVDARAIGISFTKRDFEDLETAAEKLTPEQKLAQFKQEAEDKKKRIGMLIKKTKADAVHLKQQEDAKEHRLLQQHDMFKDAHYNKKLNDFVRRKSIQLAEQKQAAKEARRHQEERDRKGYSEGSLSLWQTVGDLVSDGEKMLAP
jgi:hypothetical protein